MICDYNPNGMIFFPTFCLQFLSVPVINFNVYIQEFRKFYLACFFKFLFVVCHMLMLTANNTHKNRSSVFQSCLRKSLLKTSGCDGHKLDIGRHIICCRRTTRALVLTGFGQLSARRIHLYCHRTSTTSKL